MASRKPVFNQQVLYDTTPLPDSIPAVKEVGATSAPLLSAAFFIGARCRPYNDDYMQCKTENPGKGEFECLKEGRRVTRCAATVYVTSLHPDIFIRPKIPNTSTECPSVFVYYADEPDNRSTDADTLAVPEVEWKLNQCVFDNLKLEKTIPNTPKDQIPVHLRTKQIYAHYPILRDRGQPSLGKSIDPPSAKAQAQTQAEAPAS
ncbi:hypothetical protein E0Z10_g5089 [Xylaria hypoxylon]|uniref:Uncharacterized protein n=1 Tax=Xylaria hypoxylon TaxID=37992 RepID=A0A4Z0YI89_9PEZI|nr:hypothetical protein E0Z10_g5089 [Xylaria hypoxylon]